MGGSNGKALTSRKSELTEREKLAADGGLRILRPHLMLPSQFFPGHKQADAAEGERRLYAAVLEDAVECFQKHRCSGSRRGSQLYREAEAWLFSDDVSWPFAFVNVCEVLDIQPPFLRRHLLDREDRAQLRAIAECAS